MNVMGDIGGEFNAFKALGVSMPIEKLFLVGDLNDRGPQSKEMIQFCIDNISEIKVCDSNHGDMFVDYYEGCERYHHTVFLRNGGATTLMSYGVPHEYVTQPKVIKDYVPKEHIDFLKSLPVGYYFKDGALISHAPLPGEYILKTQQRGLEYLKEDNSYFEMFEPNNARRGDLIWNRDQPDEVAGVFQMFGHNSHWGLSKFGDWAICLDTSRSSILTGINYTTKTIFQVPFNVDVSKVRFLGG